MSDIDIGSPPKESEGRYTMTKSDAQIFTELTGGCCHYEIEPQKDYYYCNCGFVEKDRSAFNGHIAKHNTQYLHADEVLIPMREKLGEKKFKKFITSISGYHKDYFWLYAITDMIPLKYIEDVPSLVTKAIEFLEQLKKGE